MRSLSPPWWNVVKRFRLWRQHRAFAKAIANGTLLGMNIIDGGEAP